MSIPEIIAIDGPAGSGKSTLGKLLAAHLNFLYFDTGVLYRAVTLSVIQQGINVNEAEQVTHIANNIFIDVQQAQKKDERNCVVMVNGEDVSLSIYSPDVDQFVSVVAAIPDVRKTLRDQQRRIGMQGKVVMVGRDIGTVILPEADLKIYLDASVEERASRRYAERMQQGEEVDYDSILSVLQERDRIDSTRDIAPLKLANDAIVIDTDGLNIREVFNKLMKIVEDQSGRKN
jgi:cytidylate kinase